MHTVQSLRDQGIKVRVHHFRYDSKGELRSRSEIPGVEVNPKGGRVVISVYNNGKEYVGSADCSRSDSFNCQVGLSIALGRALKNVVL